MYVCMYVCIYVCICMCRYPIPELERLRVTSGHRHDEMTLASDTAELLPVRGTMLDIEATIVSTGGARYF